MRSSLHEWKGSCLILRLGIRAVAMVLLFCPSVRVAYSSSLVSEFKISPFSPSSPPTPLSRPIDGPGERDLNNAPVTSENKGAQEQGNVPLSTPPQLPSPPPPPPPPPPSPSSAAAAKESSVRPPPPQLRAPPKQPPGSASPLQLSRVPASTESLSRHQKGKAAGIALIAVAGLLQVAVVTFLLVKRKQMLKVVQNYEEPVGNGNWNEISSR